MDSPAERKAPLECAVPCGRCFVLIFLHHRVRTIKGKPCCLSEALEREAEKKSNHSCCCSCCCPVFPVTLPETLVWCSLPIRLTLSLYLSLSPAWCGMLLRSVSLRIVDFYCPNNAIIRQGGEADMVACTA